MIETYNEFKNSINEGAKSDTKLNTPFYFENVDTKDIEISVKKFSESANTVTLETSSDNVNWTPWGSTSETPLKQTIGVGERLYIRNAEDVGYFNKSLSKYNHFSSTGYVSVGGNIMSLGYKNFYNKYKIETPYAYYYVCRVMGRLVDASGLLLPATQLSDGCYSGMFDNCYRLKSAPELPATKLADGCYSSMFIGCESLKTAPILPATELAEDCYEYMFGRCKYLTTGPELPATKLADGCYRGMFAGCKSLENAPELPATKLTNKCYCDMFKGCISLNYVKAMFIDTNRSSSHNTNGEPTNPIFAVFDETDNSLEHWLDGVSHNGTFVKNSKATWSDDDEFAVPTDWNVKTATA